ncbi:MAG: hypothetical protein LUH82_03075 [Clostridiales bacterium]|nr:hypothetical protein [Clostridiales bacterium]
MDITTAFIQIEKALDSVNKELGFSKIRGEKDNIVTFKGNKGLYRLNWDSETDILSFECAYNDKGAETEFETISRSLFECADAQDKDCRSLANEIGYEVRSLFAARKKVDLDKVKMPKAVSRTKAKNGVISYDTDSLANRFGTAFPESKDKIKENIAKHGEFLAETFFVEYGTPLVLDIIKNGSEAQQKKLFKLLCEIYEDGTNEVQDIIGVTILGEMRGDPEMMAVADKYMSEYMAGPVHEINRLLKKKKKYTKKLENPPIYKPKKKKLSPMKSALKQ